MHQTYRESSFEFKAELFLKKIGGASMVAYLQINIKRD